MNPGDRLDISALPLVQTVLAELGYPPDQWDAESFRDVAREGTSGRWPAALRAGDVAVEPARLLGEMLRLPR